MKGYWLTTHFLQFRSHIGGRSTEFKVIETPHNVPKLFSLVHFSRRVVHHENVYSIIELLLVLKLFSDALFKLI